MASGRKITFQEPDPRDWDVISATGDGAIGDSGKVYRARSQSMRFEAGETVDGVATRRPARRPSPYPREHPEEDLVSPARVLAKLQNSVSTIKNLSCHRSKTDSDDNSDEGDESLQRYKQSLGLGGGKDLSDPNDPRVCIIQSLTMESPGRAPVVIDLSAPGSAENLKKTPFKIKEGATFTMSAQFKVQHEILSGLHYVQVIKRKGIRIPGGKSDEMIVRHSLPVHGLKERKRLTMITGQLRSQHRQDPLLHQEMYPAPVAHRHHRSNSTNTLLSRRGDRPLGLGRPRLVLGQFQLR
jgi:Rho GDP-dissociation inhibitor